MYIYNLNIMSKKQADLTSEVISEIGKHDKHEDDSISSENDKSDNSEKSGDSDEEKTIDQVKISKEFKENVVKFVKLDDLMRKKQQEMSELREQRKPCEQYILKYLDGVNESVIEITDGKLRKNKSETKSALTQDTIKTAISEKVGDPKIVEEILQLMENKRPMSTHVNLKRTGARQAKKDGKKKKNDAKKN